MSQAALESVLRRDRLIISLALAAVTLLAWAYILRMASQMSMGGMDMTGFRMAVTAAGMVMMPALQAWSRTEFTFTFMMWAVMMIGMMTPSAAPIIIMYARVGRQAASRGQPFASTGWFLSGYILVWTAFSLAATIAQWALDRAALLTSAMASASTILASAVLIAAGVYQWTPLKDQCLRHCQLPIEFIMRHGGFRRQPLGSLRLGVRHGSYCVGCCWAMMALLFVGGVMNVLWIAFIAALVLLEKLIRSRSRHLIPRVAGTVFVLAGMWVLVAGKA